MQRPVGYQVEKAAQAVAFLVQKLGGKASLQKILLLVYLADRRFLEKYDLFMFNDLVFTKGPDNLYTRHLLLGKGSAYENKILTKYLTFEENNLIAKSDIYFGELCSSTKEILTDLAQQFYWYYTNELKTFIQDNCPEFKTQSIRLTGLLTILGKKNPRQFEQYLWDQRRGNEYVLVQKFGSVCSQTQCHLLETIELELEKIKQKIAQCDSALDLIMFREIQQTLERILVTKPELRD